MSPTPPTLNPSQTVERIREIIVGRHLERLEGRVARLESSPRFEPENTATPIFEDRLLITEAKVEALQDHVHRIDGGREDSLQLRQEAQRLAAKIEEISQAKPDTESVPAVENLERKLGLWLTDWQKSLHVRLESRDRALAEKVESDLRALRESIESRITRLESGSPGVVSDRLEKISEAARCRERGCIFQSQHHQGMSGKHFTPLPSATDSDPGGGFKPMTGFRTALPVSNPDPRQKWFPPLVVMPSAPAPPSGNGTDFAGSWPVPMEAMPSQPVREKPSGFLPEIFLPSEKLPAASVEKKAPPVEAPADEIRFKAAPDYSDEDLVDAFAPIMEGAVRKAVYSMEKSNVDALLEPMLRATVRRALAEYSPSSSRPFQPPGFIDRTVWRMQALFSSRTYEDVLFEKTNRFQVEEVYLLDAETLALVSFASCDPARHSAVKRVESSAQRIALQIRDAEGQIRRSFERADGMSVIAEKGDQMLLVAVVRGQPNELILADLEFSLTRIEEHFQERFAQAGSALMHALQPFLEDCLLIQAPASAA